MLLLAKKAAWACKWRELPQDGLVVGVFVCSHRQAAFVHCKLHMRRRCASLRREQHSQVHLFGCFCFCSLLLWLLSAFLDSEKGNWSLSILGPHLTTKTTSKQILLFFLFFLFFVLCSCDCSSCCSCSCACLVLSGLERELCLFGIAMSNFLRSSEPCRYSHVVKGSAHWYVCMCERLALLSCVHACPH